jgi:signal transduction histidine kinase
MSTPLRARLARVSDTHRRRFGFGLIAAIAGFLVADIALAISEGDPARVLEDIVLGFTFGGVLALSMRAEPRNSSVWAMMWAGFFGALGQLAGNLGEALTDISTAAIEAGEIADSPSSLEPLAALAFAIGLTVWVPGIFLLAIHLLIFFPDGQARSVWWRRVAWTTGAIMAIMVTFGFANTAPWVKTPYDEIFADDLATGLVAGIGMLPLMFAALAAVVHLIRRYRASTGEERLQYRWVTWALAIFVLNIFTFGLTPEPVAELTSTLALANVAVAVGIAITRYRLYNIDVVVSRSLAYGAFAVFIGGIYVALVVGIGALLGGDSSFGPSIAATVAVAIAFEPGRRRMKQLANRFVYGKRATPYEVLARFSRRSSELSDEELLERIPHLIADGTGASEAALWVRTDGGFRTASAWPEDTVARTIQSSGQFADPDAEYSLPVYHDGELMGGLSLAKTGGETVTPPEEALLHDLAAGMGLALRNALLTRQLRKQVADLQASRERVLAAADAARRALERDLDSGPQQQLVALKVKLGPTRKLAEQRGAEKTAALLSQLEVEAGDAIQAVRDFAAGIYPPLLEAEGLAVAIAQHAHRAVIPVSIDDEGIGRYPRETEAAVYFTVMEALQNTTKYAAADSVSVTLAADGGRLQFEVRDDGSGFDASTVTAGAGLAGMADRLDTVGGEVRIDSQPGAGTVVSGSVPIDELVPA